MTHIKLHGQNQSEISQLLAIIDLLEEQGGHDTRLNEHRYAGVEKDGKTGRQKYIISPLDASFLVAHFHAIGAAETEVKCGELHIHHANKDHPYEQLLNTLKRTGSLPSQNSNLNKTCQPA